MVHGEDTSILLLDKASVNESKSAIGRKARAVHTSANTTTPAPRPVGLVCPALRSHALAPLRAHCAAGESSGTGIRSYRRRSVKSGEPLGARRFLPPMAEITGRLSDSLVIHYWSFASELEKHPKSLTVMIKKPGLVVVRSQFIMPERLIMVRKMAEDGKMRINVFCGTELLDGYINMDFKAPISTKRGLPVESYRFIKGNIGNLAFLEARTCDEIRVKDFFGHVQVLKMRPIVQEWERVLKSEGVLKFLGMKEGEEIQDDIEDEINPNRQTFFGGNRLNALRELLGEIGFIEVLAWREAGKSNLFFKRKISDVVSA